MRRSRLAEQKEDCRHDELDAEGCRLHREAACAAGAPPPQRRRQLDPGENQRIDAERGDVAEEAGERDEGRRHDPPARCGLEREPQRDPAEREPEPEQVVQEAP